MELFGVQFIGFIPDTQEHRERALFASIFTDRRVDIVDVVKGPGTPSGKCALIDQAPEDGSLDEFWAIYEMQGRIEDPAALRRNWCYLLDGDEPA